MGGFEETVAETKPGAGALWPTYRNTDRGSKTIQTLGSVLTNNNVLPVSHRTATIKDFKRDVLVTFDLQVQHFENAPFGHL